MPAHRYIAVLDLMNHGPSYSQPLGVVPISQRCANVTHLHQRVTLLGHIANSHGTAVAAFWGAMLGAFFESCAKPHVADSSNNHITVLFPMSNMFREIVLHQQVTPVQIAAAVSEQFCDHLDENLPHCVPQMTAAAQCALAVAASSDNASSV